MLQINFVGDRAGQEMMIEDVNQNTTMAFVASRVLQFIRLPAAKLSFVNDCGNKLVLRASLSKDKEYSGLNELAETITGFYSTGLSCDVNTNIKVIWYRGQKSVEIPFRENDTVLDLVRKACQKLSIHVGDCQIWFDSHELNIDNRTLKECKIEGGDEVKIIDSKSRKTQSGSIQIFVRGLLNNPHQLMVVPGDTVLYVKKMIWGMQGIPIEEQRLVYAGKEIENDQCLSVYNIKEDATIHLVLRLLGGGTFSMKFVDVEQTDSLVKRDWAKSAPQWRIAEDGLAIEGICTKSSCEAKGQMVIYNAGFVDFNLEKSDAKCPICYSEIKAVKPGFNNCLWKIDFQKKNGMVSKLPWKKAGNEYNTYNMEQAGTSEFTRLIIHTKKTTPSGKPDEVVCSLCHKNMDQKDMQKGEQMCGHHFHDECAKKRKKSGLDCPIDGEGIVAKDKDSSCVIN